MVTEALLWLVIVESISLATLPLAFRLFRLLPTGGYGLSKILGLLLVSYCVWLPSMLGYLKYERHGVLLVALILAAVCWTVDRDAAVQKLRQCWKQALILEVVFLGACGLGALVRAYNADIIGQEKFMDLAFFNAFLSTSTLPAEDAWLSGHAMAYYPYGYYLLSLPTKLAGLSGPVGYNLSLVLVQSLTVMLACELGAGAAALMRAGKQRSDGVGGLDWVFGLLSGTFITICGNLVGPLEVIAARGLGSQAFWELVGVKGLRVAAEPSWIPRDGGWWWRSSRVIPTIRPDGITEFPYFSFILGDLHPHFVALPLLLLAFAVVLVVLLQAGQHQTPLEMVLYGLILGVPIVANTWDTATAWTLFALAILAVHSRERNGRRLASSVARGLAPLPIGVMLFTPYFLGYVSQSLGLGIGTDRTPPISLLLIYAPFYALVALLVWRAASTTNRWSGYSSWLIGTTIVGLTLSFFGLVAAALSLSLALLLTGAAHMLLREQADERGASPTAVLLWLCLICGLGAAIVFAVEIVFIRDSFGTRMNTVFKFYYHVWVMLGLASGPILALAVRRSAFGTPGWTVRVVGAMIGGVALSLGMVYPVLATLTKSDYFRSAPTLDGAAFLQRSRPDDAAAIRWLAGQSGRPVVLEAVGGDYTEFARVSVFSGLPTLLGWVGHELQWRGPLDEYGRRQRDIDAIYQRAAPAEALRLLQQHRVQFVFVGGLEREKYGRQIEERFGGWLVPAFRSGTTTVYAVPRGDGPS